MKNKFKINFYIDGFNIYHKIKEYQYKTGKCYKWLNYKSLFESLLQNDEEINKIYFFTAIAKDFEKASIDRHNKYITALENVGIEIIMGRFIPKPIKRTISHKNHLGKVIMDNKITIYSREEKETDVNIALFMLRDFFKNKIDEEKCDKQFLLSSDGDFIPVLKTIRDFEGCPGLITPPYDGRNVQIPQIDGLRRACFKKDGKFMVINLTFNMLERHSFPLEVWNFHKTIFVEMPKEYQTF